ncbi:MAG: helix-turn-helix domain-containing protein [Bacteroidota bacterium]
MSASEKVHFLENMILSTRINARFFIYRAAMVLQVVFYSILIARELYYRQHDQFNTYGMKGWHKTTLFLYAGFGLAYLIQMVVYGFFNSIQTIVLYFAIFMAIMAGWILLFVTRILLVPEMLKWRPKTIRTPLSSDRKAELIKRIETLMDQETLFLDQDLRLYDLAHRSGVSQHQLSQILNESFEMNFYEFVNSYRIKSAKQFLLAKEYSNYTIDAIAQEVGFKSKSTFYQAFRKFVGTTPSAFRRTRPLTRP